MDIITCFVHYEFTNRFSECFYCKIHRGDSRRSYCPFEGMNNGKKRTLNYKEDRYLFNITLAKKLVDQFISIHIE